MQKHQTAIEDELQNKKKAWRDKMIQHEVRCTMNFCQKTVRLVPYI